MLQSFIVYTGLLITLPFLGHTANQISQRRKQYPSHVYYGFLALIILIFGLIFGARYKVGIDFMNYKYIYETIASGHRTQDVLEPGYIIICENLGMISNHSFLFFCFFATLQIWFIIAAFKNKPKLLPWILLILLSTQFMVMMTLIRQMTFVCCFIWIITRIDKLNLLKYCLIIGLCAFFFHKSALLMLPLYPLIRYKGNLCGNHYFQIAIYFFALYIGKSQFVLNKFDDFSSIAILLGYESYEGAGTMAMLFMDLNWGPRTYVKFIIVLMSIILSPKVKEYFSDEKILYGRFYNIFFLGVCAEAILYGIDVICRVFLPLYYMKVVINAFTLAYVIYNYKKNFKSLFICTTFVGLLLIDYTSIFYEVSLPDNTTAFRFFWQV